MQSSELCPSCQKPVLPEAQFCPRCGHRLQRAPSRQTPVLQPPAHQPEWTGEQVFFQQGNVRVSNLRIHFGGTIIATPGVAAVNIVTRENRKNTTWSKIWAGGILIAIGFFIQDCFPWALILGGLVILRGLFIAVTYRRWHEVVLKTRGGPQVFGFKSLDEARRVAGAVSGAMGMLAGRGPGR